MAEGGRGRARVWHACVPVSWPCGFLGLMLHPWVRASGSVIVFWPWPSDCQSVLSGWDSVSLSAELHCLLHCSVMSCIVTGRSKRTDPPRSFKGHWTAPCLDAAALSDDGDRSVLWRRRPKIKGLPHIDRAASAEAALTPGAPRLLCCYLLRTGGDLGVFQRASMFPFAF